jgi:hypothetical protein
MVSCARWGSRGTCRTAFVRARVPVIGGLQRRFVTVSDAFHEASVISFDLSWLNARLHLRVLENRGVAPVLDV